MIKQVNVLNLRHSFGTCGRVDEGSWEGSDVRGIVSDGIRTDADGEQSGCMLAPRTLLGTFAMQTLFIGSLMLVSSASFGI